MRKSRRRLAKARRRERGTVRVWESWQFAEGGLVWTIYDDNRRAVVSTYIEAPSPMRDGDYTFRAYEPPPSSPPTD